MANIESPILTIAIPTYNRANYLNRCLFYITSQINLHDCLFELVVSDNNSSDETSEVVKKYIDLGYDIKYIKNSQNLGPDINIDNCYNIATGKYVLALGDDDILVSNSLYKLIDLLKNDDYGLVYLNSKPIIKNDIFNFERKIFNTKEYQDQNDFINEIGYNLTFISANIINTKFYNKNLTSLYYGTNMAQIPFILEAILFSNKNLIINDEILRAQVDNTGGYKIFKVFGTNLNLILHDLSKIHPKMKFRKIIIDKLLTLFFPFWIIKLKKVHNFENEEDPNLILKPLFYKNLKYWIYCYPLKFMPYQIAISYNFITLIPFRVKKYFYKLLMSVK